MENREAGAEQRVLPLVDVLVDTGQGLRELVIESGLQVLSAMLEEDRTGLCGARYERGLEKSGRRHGYDRGLLSLGGRKVRVRKPRVRSVEGSEVPLPTWERLRAEDPLQERMLEQMVLGISTRNYERSLEELPTNRPSVAVKKSSVSRRFVARTSLQVNEFLSRSLEGEDIPIVMVDGLRMGKHVLVAALGIDRTGKKKVLSVRVGATENERLCRSMFRDLIDRGLDSERPRFFVIDGSKALQKAIVSTFGEWAVLQRCQVHKLRNVLDHLPKSRQPWMRSKLCKIFQIEDAKKARRAIVALADGLEEDYPGAASSLREGLDELFTLRELGVPEHLHRILRSTNIIENLNGRVKDIARRVKRWRGGSMACRWAVSGLIEAEKKFRRIRGHQDMPLLLAALERVALAKGLTTAEQSA